jgi:mycothiol synthase
MTLTSRTYTGTTDLEPLVELLLMCRVITGLDPWPPIREIRWHLGALAPAARADTRLWEDDTGAVLAFASLWDGETLVHCIHPRARSDDLLDQILAWAQARAEWHVARRGKRATVGVLLRADNRQDGVLLECRGFVPEASQTLRMARRLDAPLPMPVVPNGFTIRKLAGECELAAIVALHQEVFATMSAADERRALMYDPDYRPDMDLVAVAPDGTFAGFCVCSISSAEEQRPGHLEGWVELLGTRRRFRHRGLGQALLFTGLQRLMAHGVDTVLLSTTSWNTSAQRLYASAGFRTISQLRWYIWQGERRGDDRRLQPAHPSSVHDTITPPPPLVAPSVASVLRACPAQAGSQWQSARPAPL